MTTAATTRWRRIDIVEPFRHYAADWTLTSGRTDTPDLMGMFTRAYEDAMQAEGAQAMDAEMRAIHADLAEASLRSLPDD
jgi:hypothetical protein